MSSSFLATSGASPRTSRPAEVACALVLVMLFSVLLVRMTSSSPAAFRATMAWVRSRQVGLAVVVVSVWVSVAFMVLLLLRPGGLSPRTTPVYMTARGGCKPFIGLSQDHCDHDVQR